jgi:hypothetical protein
MRDFALFTCRIMQFLQMHLTTLFKNLTKPGFSRPFCWVGAVAFLLFLVPVKPLAAQDMEVGPMVGGAYYIGDLNPSKHFINTQIMYGGLIRYDYDMRWAFRLALTMGKIRGSSAQSSFLPDNQLNFSSNITDFSGVVEFNFFPYFIGSKYNLITPYIYAGIGGFFFEPVSGGHRLRAMGTEGQNVGYDGRKPYSNFGIGIPLGIGVKFSVARYIGLSAFWELHKTFTDYLDDVSQTYYLTGSTIDVNDPAQVLSDPSMDHQPGMQRGNSSYNDWFSFFGVSVTYKFSLKSQKKCRDKRFN